MKKLLIFFSILLISISTIAQIVNIPDPIFKYVLVNELVADFGDGVLVDADINNDGEIQVSEAEAVQKLFMANFLIDSIEGIQSFINLTELVCAYSNLVSVDVSQNLNLEVLNFRNNQITNLDITQNTNIEYLDFAHNLIEDINLTKNIGIRTLFCDNNQLNSLNLNQNNNLELLQCKENLITSLSLAQNPNLFFLSCSFNLLSAIDVTQNPLLDVFYCYNNQLTNIDVTQNPILEYFFCRYNQLTSIDVTQNYNLLGLVINNNQITNLDVSQNPILGHLKCNNNQLLSIDISQNLGLGSLECNDNQLTTLNIQNGFNENFNMMYAFNNPNLFCIQVDNVTYSNNQDCSIPNQVGWCKDEIAFYSEDCNLGTNEVFKTQITCYPNPVQNILNINNTSSSPITSIEVYDLLGKLVLSEKSSTNQIDVSYLNSGLFFIRIETEQGSLTKKMVKK